MPKNIIKGGGTGKLRTQAKLPRKILLQGWNTDGFNTYINSEYTLNFEFNESFNETMPYYINEIQSHKIYIRYFIFSWVIQDLDPDGLYVQFINNSQDKTKLPMTGWQYVEGNPPIGTIIQV